MTDDEIEVWESGYERWQTYHSLAFGWDGPQGSDSARKLFLYWEKLFFAWLPTERELGDATDWMVESQDNFRAKWQEHYAIVRGRILAVREASNPGAKIVVQYLEDVADRPGRHPTAIRIRNELAAKFGSEFARKGAS